MERFRDAGIQVIPVDTVQEALKLMLLPAGLEEEAGDSAPLPAAPLAAAPAKG